MIPDWERMTIWKMGNPPTLLHDWNIHKVDEQFIVTRCGQYRPIFRTLYFISTETLQVVTNLSGIHTKYDYNRGLLFQCRDDWIVRMAGRQKAQATNSHSDKWTKTSYCHDEYLYICYYLYYILPCKLKNDLPRLC